MEQRKDTLILFTGDMHCGVENGFGLAGLQALQQAAEKSCDVLLADVGDSIQGEPLGTITGGSAMIELMNAMGYAVSALGNHELDYGMAHFLKLRGEAHFPFVCANLLLNGEPVLSPYAIRECAGRKIAFVGVTTPAAMTPMLLKELEERGEGSYDLCRDGGGQELYTAVQRAVDSARAEGAELVLLLCHLGCGEAYAPWSSEALAAGIRGADAIINGHDHIQLRAATAVDADGQELPLIGCGTRLESVGWLRIDSEGKKTWGLHRWDDPCPLPQLLGLENEATAAIEKATALFREQFAQIVARSDFDLLIDDPADGTRRVRRGETNLGDLCCDAYRAVSGAEIAFTHGGGIRTNIPAGEISREDIFTVKPFGDKLCVMEVPGQELLDILEWGARALPGECGDFLHVSGMSYHVDLSVPSPCREDENGLFAGIEGQRRVHSVLVGGEPIDPERLYISTAYEYHIRKAGLNCSFFSDNRLLADNFMLVNQALIDYIEKRLGGVIPESYAAPYGQGRIVIEG